MTRLEPTGYGKNRRGCMGQALEASRTFLHLLGALVILSTGVSVRVFGQNERESRLFAHDPFTFQVEDPNSTYRAGLAGMVTRLNPPGVGYGRFLVSFTLVSGTPATDNVEIDFSMELIGSGRGSPQVQCKVVIPNGNVSASTELLIPNPNTTTHLSFSTRVNGDYVSGLSARQELVPYDDTRTSIVFLGTDEDLSELEADRKIRLVALNSLRQGNLWQVPFEFIDGVTQGSYAYRTYETAYRVARMDLAATDPLDWTTVRKIVMRADVLASANPAMAECLRQYVRASGELIILGDDGLTSLKSIFHRWAGTESSVSSVLWTSARIGDVSGYTTNFGFGKVALMPETSINEIVVSPELVLFLETQPNSGRDMGRVDAIRNQEFWTWSLQKLGQPPVAAFTVLIGLFVGVFAPGLLWYCIRTNRPAWLLLVLPIIALAGTLSLISFAMLSDGFDAYSRVRSLTILDPAGTSGVCLSRQVMFSGLQPRQGVPFAKSSEVWLIESDAYRNQPSMPGGQLQWTNDRQIYGNVIRAREQFQFSVCQPIADLQPFEWVEYPQTRKTRDSKRGGAETACRIKNTLGDTITLLIVSDGEGQFYQGQNIAMNQVIELTTIDNESAARALNQMEASQPLRLPAGLDSSTGRSTLGSVLGLSSNRYYIPREVGLFLRTRNELLNNSTSANRRFYFAYAAKGEYVDRAIDLSNEQDSLHLVYGTWSRKP